MSVAKWGRRDEHVGYVAERASTSGFSGASPLSIDDGMLLRCLATCCSSLICARYISETAAGRNDRLRLTGLVQGMRVFFQPEPIFSVRRSVPVPCRLVVF